MHPAQHSINLWDSYHLHFLPTRRSVFETVEALSSPSHSRFYRVLTGNDYQFNAHCKKTATLQALVNEIDDYVKAGFAIFISAYPKEQNICLLRFTVQLKKAPKDASELKKFNLELMEEININQGMKGHQFGKVKISTKHNLELWNKYHMAFLCETPSPILRNISRDPTRIYHVLNGADPQIKVENEKLEALRLLVERIDSHVRGGFVVLINESVKDENTSLFEFYGSGRAAAKDSTTFQALNLSIRKEWNFSEVMHVGKHLGNAEFINSGLHF